MKTWLAPVPKIEQQLTGDVMAGSHVPADFTAHELHAPAARFELRHVFGKSIGSFGALLSGFAIATIGAMSLVPVYAGLTILTLLPIEYGAVLGFVLAAIGGFFGNLPLARYMLRALPPKLQGRPRYVLVGMIAIGAVCLFVNLVWIAFETANRSVPLRFQEIATGATDLLLVYVKMYFSMFFSPVGTASNFGFLAGCVIGWMAPFCFRQLRPRAFMERPFVVFLRRFSTFSDREVTRSVMAGLPPGLPVAMLTATGSRAGDWNPFIIGYAGLKLHRPIRSMPIVLRSTDTDWRDAAEMLIARAQRIFIDLSEGSGPISEEMAMIEKHGRCDDTIILAPPGPIVDQLIEARPAFAKSEKIEYRHSWLKAVPRLVVGIIISLIIGFIFLMFAMLALILILGIHAPMMVKVWAMLMLLGACIALMGFVFVSFFVRPALDRAAYQAIRRAVRGPHAGNHKVGVDLTGEQQSP